jgi:hypothetical protein
MSRTKFIMKAPPGSAGQEAVIGGTYYFPEDETGICDTTNAEHVEIMKQHGYTLVEEVGVSKTVSQMGLIPTPDDLGRGELLAALTVRGLTFPVDSGRAFLAEQAEQWNQARRGPSRFTAPAEDAPPRAPANPVVAASTPATKAAEMVVAPSPAEPAQTAPATPPAPAAATGAMPDFRNYSRDDLKAYLVARGADGYRPNLTTEVFIGMAEKVFKDIAENAQAPA